MVSAKFHTQTPVSADFALSDHCFIYSIPILDVECYFKVKPFSFKQLKIWDDAVRMLSFDVQGIGKIDYESLLRQELAENGGHASVSDILTQFSVIFGAEILMAYSDPIAWCSEPCDNMAEKQLLAWGKKNSADWWHPKVLALEGKALKSAFASFLCHEIDPLSCKELITNITKASLSVKKKLLNIQETEEGTPHTSRNVWQTYRRLKESHQSKHSKESQSSKS